ncbi:rRNA maturation RNase YbeY [Bombilactobacillus thymidiniphilus]|uniref:Endoribonuclease YbeY n=1 Tax=Bombilactobacillus thymidiniphilus TaxID=2923363 RepID=A0ABY4PDE2_9LACO|nr:rRNA maturation RNase YbeY [Bombilactobacillus thymidiniphilus]UQS83542.1 rRNA maturation RNase YbeY [Bombilactobacillus thymidiniphilus]
MNLEIYDDNQLVDDKHQQLARELFDYGAKQIDLPADTEASITFSTLDEIHKINLKYRQMDRPTDVISFAIEDADDTSVLEMELGIPRNIGDLFICPEIVQKQAVEYGHSLEREFGYTVIHGLLHLSGYDHIQDDEAEVMFSLQEKILDNFGLQR